MFDIHRVELDWGGRKLVLETGKIARQADGAVVATYGESKLLATVVAAKEPKEGIDFLPLTCNYVEKFYAVLEQKGLAALTAPSKPAEKSAKASRKKPTATKAVAAKPAKKPAKRASAKT